MTRTTTALDGADWAVRDALGLTWQWYVDAPLPPTGNNVAGSADAVVRAPGWMPAVVPGSVVTDLHRADEVPDPYTGRGTRACEWTAVRSWVYRRPVRLGPPGAGHRVVLELDGVDPGAMVFWDGRHVGSTGGLYEPVRIDVTAWAAPGEHRLAVVVQPVPDSQPQVGRTELVRRHAPRMNLEWDFCPRFPHQGIWRPVRLTTAATHLCDVQVATTVDEALQHGRVSLRAGVEPASGGAVVEAALMDGEQEVVRGRATVTGAGAGAGAGVTPVPVQLDLEVDRPRPWWPNGHGEQHLYRLEIRVDGEPVTERTVGFRHVRMVANPGAPPEALPYTAVVNGVVVPLVGWNWVPVDAQHGTGTPERLRHLVELAARSGARLLRVWGGGLVETPEFYDACDGAGLLVWQELSQSSSGMQSAPATDEAFVAHMRAQAAVVVPPRTHHPSLLMWGGGNELDEGGVPLDEERSPVLAALREEVARLDPGRHWVPTSPSGPAFHHRADVIAAAPQDQHDVHGPWEHQGLTEHHTLHDAGTSLAHTEFGVEGMTNLRTLRALVPAQDRWPADRTNPLYRHLGDWWNNAELVQRSFGGRLADVEQLQRASQLLQATGLAYAVEADRRRSPRCSMVLPWQLNESYPNAWCTSVVDHRGDAKPAYHAVTRAFADVRVTAQVETSAWVGRPAATVEAWVWARGGAHAGSCVTAVLRTADGAPLASAVLDVTEPVGAPVAVGTLEVPLAGVPDGALLLWDLCWRAGDGTLLDREVVLASAGADLGGLLDLPVAEIAVTSTAASTAAADDGGDGGDLLVEVTHVSGPVVVGLQLVDARDIAAPGWAVVTADPRPLLPGHTCRFGVRWRGAGGVRPLRLESWNTEPIDLDEEMCR